MKSVKNILLLWVITGFITACNPDEFLDQKPIDFVTPDNFSTEQDINLAVTGAYKALTMMDLYESNTYPIYTDFMVDNGFMDKTWSGEVEFWDQSHNPNSLYTVRKWTRNYSGILRANTVLEYMDQVPMDSVLKERYRGEALFLRAWYYADLIEFYGDVPLRIKPDGIEDKDKERTDKDIVLQQIITDLEAAIERLPETYNQNNNGRATKGAAMGLKARTLLYNKMYSEAAAACQDVIDLGIYSIHPTYGDLFLAGNDFNNDEVIFDIQFVKNATSDNLTGTWWTYFFAWSSYMALENLEREYYMNNGLSISDANSGYDPQDPWINRDPRLDYTLVLPYSFNGYNKDGSTKTYYPESISATNFTGLRIRKYIDYDENEDYAHRNSGVNHILLRYADVLLMRAEALVESGNYTESEVTALINEVRLRADVNMPIVEDAEGSGLTSEELRQIIRHERRVEFAYEGTRMSDIKRWDMGETAYSPGMGYEANYLTNAKFRLIAPSFDSLAMEGVPTTVLSDLRGMENDKFQGQSAFLDEVEDQIGAQNLNTYKSLILKHSYPAFYLKQEIRNRTFNSNKGYLWPIPLSEMVSNNKIGNNNPGY